MPEKLLAINIPTFERIDSFSTILNEIVNEIQQLPESIQSQIAVNVYDNNSSSHITKRSLCDANSNRLTNPVGFFKNEHNIGADANIFQCCVGSPESTFTWVLGDDDHVTKGSLLSIISVLLSQQQTLGLLILRDGTYPFDSRLVNKRYHSYLTFAQYSIRIQPHVLIAHTLISCNIFRTLTFDKQESLYTLNELTPRLNLKANFAHMRGIVKGLLSKPSSQLCVAMPDFVSLDTTKRLASEVRLEDQIEKIYNCYYTWLLSETGASLGDIADLHSTPWLFKPLL
jgi:hypothetical protein